VKTTRFLPCSNYTKIVWVGHGITEIVWVAYNFNIIEIVWVDHDFNAFIFWTRFWRFGRTMDEFLTFCLHDVLDECKMLKLIIIDMF